MSQKEDNSFDVTAQSPTDSTGLLQALNSQELVRGFTHNHYRYPARFSPEFAREVISVFSRPGDLVLDPFMGGGTSAVEALAMGRRFFGADANTLAHFVSSAKTDLLDPRDEAALFAWLLELPFYVPMLSKGDQGEAPSVRNVPSNLQKAIGGMLRSVDILKTSRQQRFARCSILRTAQWALDCKSDIPTASEFRSRHQQLFFELLAGHQEFTERVLQAFASRAEARASKRLVCADTASLRKSHLKQERGADLVLTSPPYLGVHVLYHRWQVQGRRETWAPYWIAGHDAEHSGIPFTFAERRSKSSERYFAKLKECLGAVQRLMAPRALLVQLVAFADPDKQLPFYLKVMKELGLQECELRVASNRDDTVRNVPNRKWYALVGKQSKSSREYLLIHRNAPLK